MPAIQRSWGVMLWPSTLVFGVLLFMRRWAAHLGIPRANPVSSGQVSIGSRVPTFNCFDYHSFPNVTRAPFIISIVVATLKAKYPTETEQTRYFSRWLSHFHPRGLYAEQVQENLVTQLVLGVRCGKLWPSVPTTMERDIAIFRRDLPTVYKQKYHAIPPGLWQTENMVFHHGLKVLDPGLRRFLKSRSILDCGGHIGTSALVFSEYGRDVYSIELCKWNIRVMEEVLKANPLLSHNIVPVHAGITDHTGQICLPDCGGYGSNMNIRGPNCETVPITRIDDFVDAHNLTVGFIKADVEGHGLELLKGALRTLTRDRPIVSMSAYHSLDEFFAMPEMLMEHLTNYEFEWHMEKIDFPIIHELAIFGVPKEQRELGDTP